MAWEAGYVGAQSFKSQPGTALEIADAGDFEKDQPFSAAVWVKLAPGTEFGALVARMDDEHGHRGWDIWFEKGHIASHIANTWDSDAIRAATNTTIKAGEWNHVLLSYDGSAKAKGIKIYINGAPQAMNLGVDRLQNSIRTTVPLKIAQRQAGGQMNGALIQDLPDLWPGAQRRRSSRS